MLLFLKPFVIRKGDGRSFPRNPRSDGMLARLAEELVKVDKDI
jgi:palmitoyltransferase